MAGTLAGWLRTSEQRYDHLLPLLEPDEQIVPGVATFYRTACRECPAGCGMVVRNREGRAVKCEGNPDHPINRGRLCARGQAALQGLYDPDRIKTPLLRDASGKLQPVSWEVALAAVGGWLAPARRNGGLAVISDLQTGAIDRLLGRWLEALDGKTRLVYEPASHQAARSARDRWLGVLGAAPLDRQAQPVPVFDLSQVDFLLSLDADFLDTWVSPVYYTRTFTEMRRPRDGRRAPFVYAGPRISLTAANADERLPVRPGEEHLIALAMLQTLAEEGRARPPWPRDLEATYKPEAVAPRLGITPEYLRELAHRFGSARAPLALGGPGSSDYSATASAAAMLNLAVATPALRAASQHALSDAAGSEGLAEDLADQRVGVAVVLGANPVYTSPHEGGLGQALAGVKHLVCLTPYLDETAALAECVLPIHTPLESWGDYEPQTGVANLMQPVMGALYDTRMAGDALMDLAEAAGADRQAVFGASSFYEFLRNRWREKLGRLDDFETPWRDLLRRGGLWSSSEPQLGTPLPSASVESLPPPPTGLSLCLYPTMGLFDGRGANKRWLQELPDPMTKIAWATWVEMNPRDAAAQGLADGDVVEVGGGVLTAPLRVDPGVAPGVVAVPLGQGHTAYGRYAAGVGANGYVLAGAGPVTVTRTGGREVVPTTDGSPYQWGRGIVRTVGLAQLGGLQQEPLDMPLPEGYTKAGDLYPPHPYQKHRWAMVVDLDRCVGCGACVTACYAENNIGVIGPQRQWGRRMMAWIRVDRYYDWAEKQAPVLFQPMMCQQCDAAPCEPVCPVFASAHNEEGLNQQVYNRCVGTRYCSHNCPYKVRRFNWFDWKWPEPLNWQANPEVTVRRRGVMEKCSFCIQRIREAEFRAEREGREVRDGEIIPACMQTCPAGVFHFGDLMSPQSEVARIVAAEPRAYQVWQQLNTKPAVFYLKKIVEDTPQTQHGGAG
jgi:molybdopterin-containing oxidoreductase family iron-sulfur binding subunit